MKRIGKIRRMLLLSSGKIHTLSMSSGALKNQPKQKRGRAIALPAPPPPRSLALRLFKKVSHTMLRMAKNLNALQYVMNINNGKQNVASFVSSRKRTIKSIDRC